MNIELEGMLTEAVVVCFNYMYAFASRGRRKLRETWRLPICCSGCESGALPDTTACTYDKGAVWLQLSLLPMLLSQSVSWCSFHFLGCVTIWSSRDTGCCMHLLIDFLCRGASSSGAHDSFLLCKKAWQYVGSSWDMWLCVCGSRSRSIGTVPPDLPLHKSIVLNSALVGRLLHLSVHVFLFLRHSTNRQWIETYLMGPKLSPSHCEENIPWKVLKSNVLGTRLARERTEVTGGRVREIRTSQFVSFTYKTRRRAWKWCVKIETAAHTNNGNTSLLP
jgi:hypothetical protein